MSDRLEGGYREGLSESTALFETKVQFGSRSRSFWAKQVDIRVGDEDELVVEIEELRGGLSRSRGVFGTILPARMFRGRFMGLRERSFRVQ